MHMCLRTNDKGGDLNQPTTCKKELRRACSGLSGNLRRLHHHGDARGLYG
eukprot:CAMPEP_0198728404 /NCGR_PEP_ID=MMETSP1475-20131203/9085_1 /TAXON_ID= ORGANISM="Unidentified sp., Strain CCMP1999" /NCGR_SAMPLE_ID=MMETSP1475 /ASSEMBLY_ACC=CAM_ASM_001111 /LENGTH=49 /DNA_ID= /DNA_START= /DNA_END= /DNA_ORIENTATION=